MSKAAAINWAMPLDRRLDQLVALANDAGASTRRNELAAAIIAAAPEDAEDLLGLVLAWRKVEIKAVILDVSDAAMVVDLPRYKPGRRRQR